MSLVGDVVSTSIKVARTPFDLANRLVGRRGLEVDEADARIRQSAGALAGDEKLRAEGARRKAATTQRKRAEQLRADADKREKAAATTAERARENLSELTDRERLERSGDEVAAMRARTDAQTAADEADRLGEAAARIKSQRKANV